ncbi:MAG: fibronectin type III domain-containing protein [Saprospiraceae bacterium]
MQRIFLLLLLIAPVLLFGQKDDRIAKGVSPITEIPVVQMPPQDNAALMAEENARRAIGVAYRFAENIPTLITPNTHGQWEFTPDMAVWRVRIASPGAYSLNLGFGQYVMPAGGKLLLYRPDYQKIAGPFTPADNEDHEQLWTPIISGDELVIEVQLPHRSVDDLQLKLDFVNHAFEDFLAVASGSCNLDVICGQADGWGIVDPHRDIIQSVAVISTGGGTFCTGFLVNNVAEDCTPYFMTANHCGINASNAPSLVAYWNFQNSVCRQPNSPASGGAGNGTLDDFNTGAIFRATRSASDFTLVELDDPVSETANAYFAGWDARGVAVSSAIGIHHPSTDEKRISFENNPLSFTTYSSSTPTSNYTHVRVADWDVGTTEGGSSGSPLFDQNERVIGQLHGGGAACGNNLSDWYGSFAVSWNSGTNANSRLRDWLDPGNTGTMVLDGRWSSACGGFGISIEDPAQTACKPTAAAWTVEAVGNFTGSASLTVVGAPAGATFSFNPAIIEAGETSTLTMQTTNVTPGNYNFTIRGNDGSGNQDVAVSLLLLPGSQTAPTLSAPANNATGLAPNPILSWNGDNSGATTYQVQIATNANFTTIVETANTTSTSFQPTLANNALTRYYWRVRATNECGTSPYSTVFNFTTNTITCVTFSANAPIAISAVGTPSMTDEIFIDEDQIITSVSVHLEVTHTYVGDLDASIVTP